MENNAISTTYGIKAFHKCLSTFQLTSYIPLLLFPWKYSVTSLKYLYAFSSLDVILKLKFVLHRSIFQKSGPVKIPPSIFAFDRFGNMLEMYLKASPSAVSVFTNCLTSSTLICTS